VCINEEILAVTDGPQPGRFGLEMSRKPKTEQGRRRKSVLLVDRHALIRHAAASWINHCPGLEVCGLAGGRAQAFRAVKRFHPDVVVSEIMQPHDLGFIRELHRRERGLRILVFSMRDPAQYGAQARAAGASGYVMKAAGGENLIRNIRSVLRRRSNGRAGTPKRI
jgi:DNA-binding NarL/FixJ family response regulator